jgi:hypothetical protein
MYGSMKLIEKLEGMEKLCAWKYRIELILVENDLAIFIKEEVLEPEDATEKESIKRTQSGPKESLQIQSKTT